MTSLKADVWEQALRQLGCFELFQHTVEDIRNGFSIGISWSLCRSIIHPNHSSALNFPTLISEYIKKEESLGRYSIGYAKEELERLIGPFYCAPLGTVDKNPGIGDGKKRVIHDDSFPRGSDDSLNARTTDLNYQYSWSTFTEIVGMVIAAPAGTVVCGFDAEAAYRMCATKIEDQNYTVIGWEGMYHVDRCPQFGQKNGGVPHGRVTETLRVILEKKFQNIANRKWADDHIIFLYPTLRSDRKFTYGTSLAQIVLFLDTLGYKTNRAKDQSERTVFKYIGLGWCIVSKTVWLLEGKQEKYAKMLELVLSRKPRVYATLEEAEKLFGYLQHSSLVVREGRARLRSLVRDLIGMEGYGVEKRKRGDGMRWNTHELSGETVLDLRWWRDQFKHGKTLLVLKDWKAPNPTLSIYTDASTSWGIGVMINGKWQRWKLMKGWKKDGRDIGWAEAIGVELAVRILISCLGVRDTHLLIHCDNNGVVEGWQKGNSRNAQQNGIILKIFSLLIEADCWLSLEYVPSEHNPADAPSRGGGELASRASWALSSFPHHLRGLLLSNC